MCMARRICIVIVYLSIAIILFYIHFLFSLLFLVAVVCNYIYKRHVNKCCPPVGREQNVDVLILGDKSVYDVVHRETLYSNVGIRSIVMLSQGRSLQASNELMRTLFSLVKEDGEGTIEIYVNRNNLSGYSLYDIHYLHPISLKRIGISEPYCINMYPLWCYIPFKLVSLIKLSKQPYQSYSDMIDEMKQFCTERNLKILIYAR